MSVETPDPRDETTNTTSDVVKVKAAGEGASKVENPFDNWLPAYGSAEDYEADYPAGESKADVKAALAGGAGTKGAAKLIETAKKFIGTPYKWGGASPLGFDCSGFTQYLYRQIGIDLPRVSYQQAAAGPRITIDQLKPGDLVFWDTSDRNNGADHVAIYIGNGQVIQAPKPGDAVKISPLWNTKSAWGASMNL